MLAMLILQLFPVWGSLYNHVPPGPTALVFSVIYQYFRLIPEAYKFKVFGATFSDKIFIYATASQVRYLLLEVQPRAARSTKVGGIV